MVVLGFFHNHFSKSMNQLNADLLQKKLMCNVSRRHNSKNHTVALNAISTPLSLERIFYRNPYNFSSYNRKCSKGTAHKQSSHLLQPLQIADHDKTTYFSCNISPKKKSILRKTQFHPKLCNKIRLMQSPFGKENLNQTNKSILKAELTINFYFESQKLLCKNVLSQATVLKMKQQLAELLLTSKWLKAYTGIVRLVTLDVNLSIDSVLENQQTRMEYFISRSITTLDVEVILAKDKLNYQYLQLSSFSLLKYIGEGGFSKVYLARCKIDGVICALKFITKNSVMPSKRLKMIENQKDILFSTNHHRLVDLYYAFETKNYIVFGLRYCPQGNLYQYLKQHKQLSEEKSKSIFYKIVEGLQYLHSRNILFRDLKLENILFDENGEIRLTDFGLSKPEISEQSVTYSYCGSPEYMAPEMLSKCGHNYQIDHYALGVVLYELLYGRSPFSAPKKQDIFQKIMTMEPKFPDFPSVSSSAKALILGLLDKNPKHRIGSLKGTHEILSHPWLRGYTPNCHQPTCTQIQNQGISLIKNQQQQIAQHFSQDLLTDFTSPIFLKHNFVSRDIAQQFHSSIFQYRKLSPIRQKNSARYLKSKHKSNNFLSHSKYKQTTRQ